MLCVVFLIRVKIVFSEGTIQIAFMITTKTENSITFHIETLERPEQLAEERVFSEIAQTFSNKIEYLPNPDEKLIDGGYHSFLYGMYLAYSEHRPFTLSPDMIWLLILQGISNHVNHQKKSGNNLFPHLGEGRTISIRNDKIKLGDSTSPWHKTTSAFSEEIEKIVGAELVGELRADFSTTTLASKVVSEITIMDTFKAYFKYVIHRAICGIPEITLEGSVNDWNHLLDKLEILKKYDLSWWYDDVKPIIEKIKNTAAEIIDTKFWMHMFKIHTKDEYGEPKSIDGWITKFFPFYKNGGRIDLKEQTGILIEDIFELLPKQMVHVDFTHVLTDAKGNPIEETAMEYWGGFVGIAQDSKTQRLTPKIDWFVSHAAKQFERDIDVEKESSEYYSPAKMFHNITQIPDEVFEKQEWDELGLFFLGKVNIPERFKEIKFKDLYISGTIDDETTERLKSYFNWKRKYILINGERLGEKIISDDEYYDHIEAIKETYILKTGKSAYVHGEMLRVTLQLEENVFNQEDERFSEDIRVQMVSFLEKYLYDEAVFFDQEINDMYFALYNIRTFDNTTCENHDNLFKASNHLYYIQKCIVDWHLHYGDVKLDNQF